MGCFPALLLHCLTPWRPVSIGSKFLLLPNARFIFLQIFPDTVVNNVYMLMAFSVNSANRAGGQFQFSSVAQLCPTLCDPMNSTLCPSPTPGVHPNSCPLSQWCHPTISSSIIPFSYPQIFPSIRVFSSESALRIRCEGLSIGVSASTSVLPMNTQDYLL